MVFVVRVYVHDSNIRIVLLVGVTVFNLGTIDAFWDGRISYRSDERIPGTIIATLLMS